ncbi:MAG: hypothetical protein OEZ13_08085 [Spirochaetia bacterium]|nr:hypothetical protein [Spirochaetia bacterium]
MKNKTKKNINYSLFSKKTAGFLRVIFALLVSLIIFNNIYSLESKNETSDNEKNELIANLKKSTLEIRQKAHVSNDSEIQNLVLHIENNLDVLQKKDIIKDKKEFYEIIYKIRRDTQYLSNHIKISSKSTEEKNQRKNKQTKYMNALEQLKDKVDLSRPDAKRIIEKIHDDLDSLKQKDISSSEFVEISNRIFVKLRELSKQPKKVIKIKDGKK